MAWPNFTYQNLQGFESALASPWGESDAAGIIDPQSTSYHHYGTYGCLFNWNNAASSYLYQAVGVGGYSRVVFGWWWRSPSADVGNHTASWLVIQNATSNVVAALQYEESGTSYYVRLAGGANVAISPNTEYWYSFDVNRNGTCTLNVYNASFQLVGSSTATGANYSIDYVILYKPAGAAPYTTGFDDFVTIYTSPTAPILGWEISLSASGITAAPSLGSPTVSQAHALTATAIGTTPAVGTPALGQIHALSGTEISIGVPVLDAPALQQIHALSASGISAAPNLDGEPALSQLHVLVAAGLLVGAPVLGEPAMNGYLEEILAASYFTHGLSADAEFTTGLAAQSELTREITTEAEL